MKLIELNTTCFNREEVSGKGGDSQSNDRNDIFDHISQQHEEVYKSPLVAHTRMEAETSYNNYHGYVGENFICHNVNYLLVMNGVINDSACKLYAYLIGKANDKGWQAFSCSNEDLLKGSRLSYVTLTKTRKELEKLGLIEVKSLCGNYNEYFVIPFSRGDKVRLEKSVEKVEQGSKGYAAYNKTKKKTKELRVSCKKVPTKCSVTESEPHKVDESYTTDDLITKIFDEKTKKRCEKYDAYPTVNAAYKYINQGLKDKKREPLDVYWYDDYDKEGVIEYWETIYNDIINTLRNRGIEKADSYSIRDLFIAAIDKLDKKCMELIYVRELDKAEKRTIKMQLYKAIGVDTAELKEEIEKEHRKKEEDAKRVILEKEVEVHNAPIKKEISEIQNEVLLKRQSLDEHKKNKIELSEGIDILKMRLSMKEVPDNFNYEFSIINSEGFTEDSLLGVKAKDLEVLLRESYGIEPDDFDGKNTNKKLRGLVLEAQENPSKKIKQYLKELRDNLEKELTEKESELEIIENEIGRLDNMVQEEGDKIKRLKEKLRSICSDKSINSDIKEERSEDSEGRITKFS